MFRGCRLDRSAGNYEVEAAQAEGGSISCSDDEGEEIAYSVLDQPEHGSLSPLQSDPGTQGSRYFTYTSSPPAYRGPDEFTLRAHRWREQHGCRSVS